ncbi:probable lysosomal cobalamin transporter [Lepeophtheirus salmonis]|uniref:probable lysosomal cobalamin transporter n=1 Tax=Lepeophtheirus salmonis TaxID=72036 RepID=UPI001AE0F01A|nr:probable lysosomal cobalamin transporter [Lepeophtheirus salmonis]
MYDPSWSAWIYYGIAGCFALLFSSIYVLWYRSPAVNWLAVLVCVASLTATLLTSFLVPVDIFLVSSFKFKNGTYQPWAEDPLVRDQTEKSVLALYYFSYTFVATFLFIILPFCYFFFDYNPEEATRYRLLRSLQFTCLSLVLILTFALLGYFIPFKEEIPPTILLGFLQPLKGIPVFLLNLLNVIGTFFLIIYTGIGISSLSCGMIRRERSVHARREVVISQLEEVEQRINDIRSRFAEDLIPYIEQVDLDRLEQQARLLRRSHYVLEQKARSFLNRLLLCIRPFEMTFGIMFMIVSFFIVLSLILSSVDRAMHSNGPSSGYSLNNTTLPNPIEDVLMFTQKIFPMDFILYINIVLLLIFGSVSGLKTVGIGCFCIPAYDVQSGKTQTRGLIWVCAILIYIIVALNVFMFSLVPNYTTFGNQVFVMNDTSANTTNTLFCESRKEGYKEHCYQTRISFLLTAYHDTMWIFDALYYWLHWVFIVVVLIGSLLAVYIRRHSFYRNHNEEDDEVLVNDVNVG